MTEATDLKELLLFDFDGVIINSETLMRFAFQEACSVCGVQSPPSIGVFLSFMGMPLPRIAEELGLPASFVGVYSRLSRDHMDRVTLYPGATEMLAAGARRFHWMALITGKDRLRTNLLLERFGLSQCFDALVCGDDLHPGKPDPAGVNALRQRFAASKAGTCMVGDSAIDMLCARSAGVMALGAGWGFGTKGELLEVGADLVFGSPHTLRAWLALTSWPEHQGRRLDMMAHHRDGMENQWSNWRSMAD